MFGGWNKNWWLLHSIDIRKRWLATTFGQKSVSTKNGFKLQVLIKLKLEFFFRVELFNALYRRVLCRQRVNDDQLTVTSLQALAKVYKRYHAEIGQFSDMSYILQLLDRVSNALFFFLFLDQFVKIKWNWFNFCSIFLGIVFISIIARCIDWAYQMSCFKQIQLPPDRWTRQLLSGPNHAGTST